MTFVDRTRRAKNLDLMALIPAVVGREAPLLSEDGDMVSITCYAEAPEPGCELFADTSHCE